MTVAARVDGAGAGVEAGVRAALQGVVDPEMPVVSIVDLGLVDAVAVTADVVTVSLLPTFSGCPALNLIGEQVAEAVARVDGVDGVRAVDVQWSYDPPWTPDRITEAGRAALASLGIAVRTTEGEAVTCPRCGGPATERSMFGPTRCRAVAWCDTCREPFEVMRPLTVA